MGGNSTTQGAWPFALP